MKEELWLFTLSYPFGNGESFLENELPILGRGFQRVRIFPLLPKGEPRPLPANVQVDQVFAPHEVFRPLAWKDLLQVLPRFLKVWRMSRSSAPSPAIFRKHRRELFSSLRQALERERLWRLRMGRTYDPDTMVLYSYWTSDWATILGLWKWHDPRVRFVSRMMGFDMFDHRAQDGWQRFQAFHVRQVDHVYTISEAGLKHMQQRFSDQRHKFSVSFLATQDHGLGPWAIDAELRLASCANLVPLKRVHLLAEALRGVKGPVHWTHFGEGPERHRLEALVSELPPNIRVELKGNCPNPTVIDWYRGHSVDVFVHTSETEGGVPVALQEAASFGIPLLAADAGGVREIVTGDTGVLLPNGITATMLAEALDGFRDHARWNSDTRATVREFWAARFKAEEVYGGLLEELRKEPKELEVP